MLKKYLILFLMLTAGCTALPPAARQVQPTEDLFAIEKLASAAYDKSDWKESEKHYSILVEKAPGQAQFWLRLGNIYAHTNRPDMAIVAYREALGRDSKLPNAWFNMGIIQLKQAAYSFNELQANTQPGDPVAEESRKLLEGILGLIESQAEK